MNFTSCNVNHFKVNNFTAFSIFATLCNHHFYLISRPHKKNQAEWFLLIPLTPSPWQTPICFLSLDLLVLDSHINGIIQCVIFCASLLSWSMFARFIHIVASASASFFFLAE